MSRKKSRTKTLAENREKRAKKIAIGGGVVLVALVAFQGRHLLSHSSSSSTTPPPAVTTTSGVPGTTPAPTPATTPPGTAAVGVAALAVTPTASTKLPDSEAGPKEAKSQLFSFSHFTAKDPFVQQVSSSSPTGSSTTASSGTSASTAPPAVGTASAGGPNTTPRKQARALAGAGTATISINGKVQTVHVGASFPSANPLFRLVSLTHGVARIGIANGSYASGAQTLSLATGRAVTLADTADGIRYKLRLISVS